MITKIYKRVKNKKGVKFCRNAHGKGGASSCTLKSGGAPAKRAEAEARAGKNSFPQNPFFFARPSEFFSEISIGIFAKKSSDFVQKVPPIYNFSVFEGFCLALATLGLGKSNDFIRIFEIQKQFLPAQTEVRRAKLGQNGILQPIFFLSPEAKGKAIILNILTA